MPRVSNFRVKEIANTYAGNTVQSLALDLLDAQARIKALEQQIGEMQQAVDMEKPGWSDKIWGKW